MKRTLLCLLTITNILVTSCIKEQPLNRECDIRRAVVHLPVPGDYFVHLEDTVAYIMDSYSDSVIVFEGVKETANLNGITPTFTISKGAMMFPRQGTRLDFSNDTQQRYFIIAEDTKDQYPVPTSEADYPAYRSRLKAAIANGAHVREYLVQFSSRKVEIADTLFYDFEDYYLEKKEYKYYEWSDPLNGRKRTIANWATSNMGFSTARSSALPHEYPTVPMAKDGVDGGAFVKMETRSTGDFGKMFNMPLAAGSLFLGTFDISKALTNTLKATRFGDNSILGRKPLKFCGFYRYSAGQQMTGPDGQPKEGKDAPDIYCVVYKNRDSKGRSVVLYGDDVNSSTLVVGRAKITDWVYDSKEWIQFELPFVWNEPLDEAILEAQGYNYAIVCSSSREGASYSGAVGSTLYVDKFTLVFE